MNFDITREKRNDRWRWVVRSDSGKQYGVYHTELMARWRRFQLIGSTKSRKEDR